MNLAPATGYQPQLVIDMKADSPEYQHQLLNQRYYFTANHGQDYGVLLLHTHPFATEDKCSVNASFKINSTGSRNLELKKKPSKLRFRSSQSPPSPELAGLNQGLGQQQN